MLRSTLVSVGALLAGVSLLLLGSGLLGTLLAVRARLEGFSTPVLGAVMAVYYIGFLAGSHWVPVVVRRVGHIRTFAALAGLLTAAILVHPILINAPVWGLMRIVAGFCFAGLYMVVESWLNDRAERAVRGRVFAVYMSINLGAMAVGQLLLGLDEPTTFVLFSLVAILTAVATVPVTLSTSRAPAPPPIEARRLGFAELYAVSPLGVVGCVAIGLANGAFWSLAPAYAADIGLSVRGISVFMAAAVTGGFVMQWPIGQLSDHFDRRTVLMVTAFAAAAPGLFLAFLAGGSEPLAILGAFFFGGLAMPIYALCVAHTNDFLEPADLVPASAGLLMAFGLGAIGGPLIAPLVMDALGSPALFLYTAAIHAGLGLFALYRMRQRPSVPLEEQGHFVPIERTSPVVMTMHPRLEEAAAHGEDQRAPAEAAEEVEEGRPPPL